MLTKYVITISYFISFINFLTLSTLFDNFKSYTLSQLPSMFWTLITFSIVKEVILGFSNF